MLTIPNLKNSDSAVVHLSYVLTKFKYVSMLKLDSTGGQLLTPVKLLLKYHALIVLTLNFEFDNILSSNNLEMYII